MATVIGIFEEKFKKKKPLPIVKPGTQSRRFTHIDDTVNICLGDTAFLEATDTNDLSWTTTENYYTIDDSIIGATPLLSSHYIATTSKYTDSIYLIVNPLPNFKLRNDTTICIKVNCHGLTSFDGGKT